MNRSFAAFSVILFMGSLSWAADLLPGASVVLKYNSQRTREAAQALKAHCLGLSGLFNGSEKDRCLQLIESSRFTPETVAFCKDSLSVHLELCLEAVKGLDVTSEVLAVCRKLEKGSSRRSEWGDCVSYFTQVGSSFSTEAVELCWSQSLRRFSSARACLNVVRDRQFDVEKARRECLNSGFDSTVLDCIENLALKGRRLCAAEPTRAEPGSSSRAEPARR